MKTDSEIECSEQEGFISRWSQRKLQRSKTMPNTHSVEKPIENLSVPTDNMRVKDGLKDVSELAPVDHEEQRLEKLNALTDEDMPDLDSLNEDSNYAEFLSSNVSEALRKMALQKLFHGKSYNIRDGLDEYDGDYTSFEKLDPSVITADMKHLLEVEAKKLLALKEEKKKEEEEEKAFLVETNVETKTKGMKDDSLIVQSSSLPDEEQKPFNDLENKELIHMANNDKGKKLA